jgi:AcrR family transcriptional regulator
MLHDILHYWRSLPRSRQCDSQLQTEHNPLNTEHVPFIKRKAMNDSASDDDMTKPGPPAGRRVRADAQRNLVALLRAAKEIFAESGLDAPMRDIADRAGVGIGTMYRHFPRRPDLIAAVFRQELDSCADAAVSLAAEHPPFEAFAIWMRRFVDLAATKHGLAQALYSGDPAFAALPARREQRLRPAFRTLFETAVASGAIRSEITADEFLNAAANLCMSAREGHTEPAQRMVATLVNGLRYGLDGDADQSVQREHRASGLIRP